jgi:hypothetical protein
MSSTVAEWLEDFINFGKLFIGFFRGFSAQADKLFLPLIENFSFGLPPLFQLLDKHNVQKCRSAYQNIPKISLIDLSKVYGINGGGKLLPPTNGIK